MGLGWGGSWSSLPGAWGLCGEAGVWPGCFLDSLGAALPASPLLLEEGTSFRFGFSLLVSSRAGEGGKCQHGEVWSPARSGWVQLIGSFHRTFTEVFLGPLSPSISLLPCCSQSSLSSVA